MAPWLPGAGFAAEMSLLVERLRASVVLVETPRGQGTSVIWPQEEPGVSLVVTSDHVVTTGPVVVELWNGKRFSVRVVARDRLNDLAALQVPDRELTPAPIGDARALRAGEIILAMGHPRGVRGNVALGIVSAAPGQTWMGRWRRDILVADVALAPGNSGGPLTDAAGRVLGIASMMVSPGMAVAVPSHVVSAFLRDHLQPGLEAA